MKESQNQLFKVEALKIPLISTITQIALLSKAEHRNDVLTITGKHGSLTAKTNAGDDTITIESGFTGSGNAFYGGKGEEDVVSSRL